MTEVSFRKIPSTIKNVEKSKPGASVYDDIEVCDIKLTEFTAGSYPANDLTDDGETTYAQRYGAQYAAFKDGAAPEHQNDPVAGREEVKADLKPAPQTVEVPKALAADPQPVSKPVPVADPKAAPVV